MLIRNQIILFFVIILLQFAAYTARAEAPLFRLKTGISDLKVEAGDVLPGNKLQSLVTLQPSVLWNVQTFSSRIGFHFLSELNSPFSATPISGIGISGYYYLLGISSSYVETSDEVLIQKSKPGPFLVAALTPVNVNLNRFDEVNSSDNFYLSAYVNDLMIGAGYEYPFNQNMLLSGEFVLRNGTSIESTNQQIRYSGWSIFFTFATSYY